MRILVHRGGFHRAAWTGCLLQVKLINVNVAVNTLGKLSVMETGATVDSGWLGLSRDRKISPT